MERLPYPSESRFMPPIYQASSLADMMGSGDQVREDIKARIATFPRLLRGVILAGEKFNEAFDRFLRLKYKMPGTAVCYVPVVRHIPERDPGGFSLKLTLFDPTAECQVEFPNPLMLPILRKAGLDLSPNDVRRLHWCSDVFLIAEYESYRDRFTLIHLFNHIAPETAKEDDLEVVRKLAAARVKI